MFNINPVYTLPVLGLILAEFRGFSGPIIAIIALGAIGAAIGMLIDYSNS